ncbi:hypothetical protein MLD38_000219 [Melastoma candidum]|uniref:Uncharacterized protein n=1 Tax=Melastoma candidum TaxID=119954 RepID=A0ACB9S9F4_9MYRT|nr:hypothetical protein MLD38_000219 [Melastoma candidum]
MENDKSTSPFPPRSFILSSQSPPRAIKHSRTSPNPTEIPGNNIKHLKNKTPQFINPIPNTKTKQNIRSRSAPRLNQKPRSKQEKQQHPDQARNNNEEHRIWGGEEPHLPKSNLSPENPNPERIQRDPTENTGSGCKGSIAPF